MHTIDPKVFPGAVIGGKYVVERVIGEGGMGYVVDAVHDKLGGHVALKFLKPKALSNPELVARFSQEARAAASLKGEHIARVLDVGERSDGAPYIVMEHLQGHDLGHVIEGPQITVADATEWVIHACDGLGEAHARGVVHRDVKPENLFLVERDGWRSVKVLDFGISKAALTNNDPEMEFRVMGSPCYMSPEQLRGRDVDHRSDIWSLGAVLFELLTRRTPYPADLPIAALVATILDKPPLRLRDHRPDAPAELEAIIARCLEKDPAKRFQHAAELAIALLPFAPRRARNVAEHAASVTTSAGLAVTPLAIPSLRPSQDRPSNVSRETSLSALLAGTSSPSRERALQRTVSEIPSRRSGRRYVALAAIAVLAAAIGIGALGRGRSPSTPLATAAPSVAPPRAVAEVLPSPAPAATPAPLARVRVVTAPPGATVKEGDVELCTTTPCDVSYEADEREHTLSIAKAGYSGASVVVRARDGHVDVSLVRSAPAEKHAPAPPSEAKPSVPAGFKDMPY